VPGRTSLVRGSGLAVDVGVERSWRSHVEVFQHSSAWDPATTTDTKLSLLTSDPDTIIFGADAEGTIIPLHSFANLLIGSGQGGIAVIVDPKSATKQCSFVAPPHDIIIAKKTTAELQAISDPTASDPNSGTDYAGCASFLPAPWLVDSILSSKSNDPWELILAGSTSATAFDTKHVNDPLYLTTAASHLQDFVQWAWGVKKRIVPRTDYHLDLADPALETFNRERHSRCIAPANHTANMGTPQYFHRDPLPFLHQARLQQRTT
jgi:hypothetical protein